VAVTTGSAPGAVMAVRYSDGTSTQWQGCGS
jgi:hypothetical protein